MKNHSLSHRIKSNQSTLAAKWTVKSPLSYFLGSPDVQNEAARTENRGGGGQSFGAEFHGVNRPTIAKAWMLQ